MIDKSLSEELGIYDLLDSIKYGHMRYGETIYDQQSSLIQDAIVASHYSQDEKIKLLGEHIFEEIQTHPVTKSEKPMDANYSFVKGGKTKPRPKVKAPVPQSTYFSPKGNTSDLINARNLYNSWARTKNVPELPAGGDFNDSTAAAFANFNADPTNLRKLNVKSQNYVDPANGTSRKMVLDLGLDKWMPEIKPATPIAGFNKQGDRVYEDQVKGSVLDKASGKLLVVNDDYFPTNVDTSIKPKYSASAKVDGKEARRKAFRNNGIVSNVTNLATAALGSLFASQEQPLYGPTAEYEKMRDDIYSRKDQGLTEEQNAILNQDAQSTYANSIEALKNLGGGGSNAGTVLSTLGQVSANLDRTQQNNALLNIDAQQRNRQAYQQQVMQDMGIDRDAFNVLAANAAETKQNGLAMLSQGVQGVVDQSLFNQSYGPDSLYSQLQEGQLAGTQNAINLQELQTQLALEELRRSAGIGAPVPAAAYNGNIRQLPAITIPR